jgi:ribose transport system substrate-binding protein
MRYLPNRRFICLAASLPLAATLAASSVRAQDAGKIPIAAFTTALQTYTQNAFDEITSKFGDKISMQIYNPNFNPATQVSQCQDAITTKRFKGFLLHAIDGAALVPCAKAAIAAGIKVVSWDFPPIGTDPMSEEIQVPGQSGAEITSLRIDVGATVGLTVKACGNENPCNVVMLVAVPTYGYAAMKRKETLEAFKKYPNIKVAGEYVLGYEKPEKAEAAIRTELLKGTPHVILGDDDGSYPGVERAVVAAGKLGQIKLVSAGANRNGVNAVREGKMFGDVVVLPKSGARNSAAMLIDAIEGKTIAKPVLLNQEEQDVCPNAVVVKECADKFTAEW